MKSHRRKFNRVSTGAMADIAFLLLIFFMVTTTLSREKSIAMRLPPVYDGPTGKVPDNKVLSILVNSEGQILVENHEVFVDRLDETLIRHLNNKMNNFSTILFKHHPACSYDIYAKVISKIKSARKDLRQIKSEELFNRPVEKLNKDQKLYIKQITSIRISEIQIEL